jgi:hypothetical protein
MTGFFTVNYLLPSLAACFDMYFLVLESASLEIPVCDEELSSLSSLNKEFVYDEPSSIVDSEVSVSRSHSASVDKPLVVHGD